MGDHRHSQGKEVEDQQQTTIVDEFLSTINQLDQWTEKYSTLDDVQKTELYLKVLRKIEESVQKNDVNRFGELNVVKGRLDRIEKNKALLKSTNSIIIACKYNRLEILEQLLDKETQIIGNSSTAVGTDEICNQIFDEDKAGHTACYYAIRSNNVDLLETLINPAKPGSAKLFDSLSKDYESLKIKNVLIDESMETFVEDRLVRELFLRNFVDESNAPESKKTASNPESEDIIHNKLNLIIKAADKLGEILSGFDVDGAAIALYIASNIRVLKYQLKSTDNLPCEEMEFCLSRYSFLSSVERKELQRHLIKFIAKLRRIFGIRNKSSNNESDVSDEIKDCVNDSVTTDTDEDDDFKDFCDDYALMKDDYSLMQMLSYIQLALTVNPEEQSGKLIIQRALHIMGEYVKNSIASPNLSENAHENVCHNLGNNIDAASSLRNTFSHIEELHVLYTRDSIENQEGFFTKLQEDLKKVIRVIVNVSCSVKCRRFRKWCNDIIRENDCNAFQELCVCFYWYLHENELPEDIDAPDIDALNKIETLLARIRKEIHGKRKTLIESNIEAFVAEMEKVVAIDKEKMSNKIKRLNTIFRDTKLELVKRINHWSLSKSDNDTLYQTTDMEICKRLFAETLRFLPPINILYSSEFIKPFEVHDLIPRILGNEEIVNEYSKVCKLVKDINAVFSSKSYLLMFKAVEVFKEKFDVIKVAPTNPTVQVEVAPTDPTDQVEVAPTDPTDQVEVAPTDPTDQDGNIERELDADFRMFKSVLGSEEAFQKVQLLLEKKKAIHKIKLKVDGNYEENELCVLNEKLRENKIAGKSLLGTTSHPYGEFVSGKIEFKEFAGSLRMKGNDEKLLIATFNKIKTQHDDYEPENVWKETIRQIEEKFTQKRCGNLIGKLETIKQDHSARLSLISFFDDSEKELQKEDYDKLVAPLVAEHKTKHKLCKLLTNKSAIVMSLCNDYGILVDVLKNKQSKVKKICTSYVNFLKSLQLDSNTTELLQRTIIKNKIFTILDDQFSKKLNLLKEMLGSVETRELKSALISRYRRDKKLQAVVEILLFDLCIVTMTKEELKSKFNVVVGTSEIPLASLEKGFLYLDGSMPFLQWNSLRNYLAHGDALVDSLPFDSSIAVISSAILFSEEAESLIALRDLVHDDKMAQKLIRYASNIPDQLLPQNVPSDLQCNFKSWGLFRKSNYWKYYLKIIPTNPAVVVDPNSRYEQYLSQCVSQVSLFAAASQGDKQKLESLFQCGEDIYSRCRAMRSLLHVSANKGHEDIVEVLLKNGISVDAIDKYRMTPLHLAACSGHCFAVETLLKYGAKVDSLDMNKDTPLFKATLLKGNNKVISALLKSQADFNFKSSTDLTPLHMAAMFGDLDVVKLLVEDYKANRNVRDKEGNTELHNAAMRIHNAEIFKYLLGKDCERVNDENNLKETPLLIAIKAGNDNVVKVIVEMGGLSDSSVRNKDLLMLPALQKGNLEIVKTLFMKGNIDDGIWERCTALHIASNYGHNLLAEFLIRKQVKVYMRDCKGLIPLHHAVRSGHLETVKILVEIGNSDVNTASMNGISPLQMAVYYNFLDVVKYLVEQKADFNVRDKCGWTLLHFLVSSGGKDLKTADYLIDDLNDLYQCQMLNTPNENGATPLHLAVNAGPLTVIEHLIDKGARLDVRDNEGITLLHLAVVRNDSYLVKYLIEKMKDNINEIIEAKCEGCTNILQIAISLGNTSIVDTLLKTRKELAFVHSKFTLLCEAVIFNRTSVVETLLNDKIGVDVNAQTDSHGPPLMYASVHGYEKMVKILLKNGADPNCTFDGDTPLTKAALSGTHEIVNILLDGKANINLANKDGSTPLHCAAERGHYETAKILVTRGADVDAADKKGLMPMQHAIYNSNWDIFEMLLLKMVENVDIRTQKSRKKMS